MANYRDNSSIGWKILSLFLALVLVAGIITGIVFWQKGNIVFNPVKQEQQEEKPEDSGKPVTDENGDEIASNSPIAMPTAMTFRSATALDGKNAAYDSVTVTATFTPSDAELKSVVYAAEWVNPSSTWAKGKTVSDYVTVTQTEENGVTAKIQCLKDFGEQIKVTVTGTNLDDTSVSASCTIDFAKRIVGGTITHGPKTVSFADGKVNILSLSGQDYSFSTSATEYSAYTVDDNFTSSVVFNVSEETKTEILKVVPDAGVRSWTEDVTAVNTMIIAMQCTRCYVGGMQAIMEAAKIHNALTTYYKSHEGAVVGTYTVTFEGTYSTFETEIDVIAISSALSISATDVKLNQSNVII